MPIILNSKQLAAELGRGKSYVSAMKLGGFVFTHGMKTTLQAALDWLAENPDFRVAQVYPPRRRTKSTRAA